MFDNIRLSEEQKEAINKSIAALACKGIHGTVQIDKEYLYKEDDSFIYQPKTDVITLTVVVPEDKYIEAIDITDNNDILFSKAPVEVAKDFYNEGIQDDF